MPDPVFSDSQPDPKGALVKTIGLLDHMGGGNLGDDATQEAAMQNIRNRWPDAVLYTFSMNPDDSESRHGVGSYPIRRKTWTFGASAANASASFKSRAKAVSQLHPALFAILRALFALAVKTPAAFWGEVRFLVSSFSALRSFDVLVICGGGQLTESWGGPWGFPYTIFKWIVLARLARVKPVFLSVGAGPLTRSLSKFFIRTALYLADFNSFRDAKSAELVHQIGFGGDTHVFPDLVYGLEIDASLVSRPATQRLANVGMAPMPYGLPPLYADGDPNAYDSLISGLATLGARLLADGNCVTLFCTDIGVDPPSVRDLQGALKSSSKLPIEGLSDLAISRNTKELLSTISRMDYVITCRFHGVIFAHLLNKPVIALSHHSKIMTLMGDIGLSRYCLDIRKLDADALALAFDDLVSNAAEIKSRMSDKYSFFKATLARQFDNLFPNTVV